MLGDDENKDKVFFCNIIIYECLMIYLYTHREVLYVQDTKESQPRTLLDPQKDGVMAFPNMGVSRNGELVVFREVVIAEGFPRISGNLRILNVSSGDIFPDIIEDVRNPQIAWDKNGLGFFYFSQVTPNTFI